MRNSDSTVHCYSILPTTKKKLKALLLKYFTKTSIKYAKSFKLV